MYVAAGRNEGGTLYWYRGTDCTGTVYLFSNAFFFLYFFVLLVISSAHKKNVRLQRAKLYRSSSSNNIRN